MSAFEVKVRKIQVSPHPDPETTALEIGKVDDYNVVVGKGIFKTGDLIAYIPEQSIVPTPILAEMNLVGRLAGPDKNRVKAIKLRGVLSQGICYPAKPEWEEGQDVAKELCITKWIPPIPVHMAGEVGSCDISINFDIENIKKYPDLFHEGEEVFVTEKLHGTCCIICVVPEPLRKPDMIDGKFIVISKGLAKQGLYFKDNEKNAGNLYIRTLKELKIFDKLGLATGLDKPFWVFGEVLGNGVQDLKYGKEAPVFRAFGMKSSYGWLPYSQFLTNCNVTNIPTVPVIYHGPFKKELVKEWTEGTSVEGDGCHIREGVVIAANVYRETAIGRPILKSVSEAYLTRKDKNATEFE